MVSKVSKPIPPVWNFVPFNEQLHIFSFPTIPASDDQYSTVYFCDFHLS